MAALDGALAATRFGMGSRPGEIADASSDPRGWLKAQIRDGAAAVDAEGLKPVSQILAEQREAYGGRAAGGGQTASEEDQRRVREQIQTSLRDGLAREIEARSHHAATTAAPFAERWARFWSNHFTVAARNPRLLGLVGPFEREAIRPAIFGSFAGLLKAATFHPGMLVYLDADRSIGPNSPAGKRREAGLNENLAREILELHTLGVGSGYSQGDIIEFAKALTGWTLSGPQAARMQAASMAPVASGDALFVERLHEPGARTVLGRTYRTGGDGQAAAILEDLAAHEATARHVAVKLARHFVADDPPAPAVERLQATFLRTGGDLADLAWAVIDLPEAWDPVQRKLKTPEELLVSAARAAGGDGRGRALRERAAYRSLAQVPFQAPSPAGWPDRADAWAGADAVKKRLEWANASARRIGSGLDPGDFLDIALGPMASERTRSAVSRAESAEQGLTLALMCPEFQRR